MKPRLIEAALDGIKPINHNILKLVLALPEEQQENALMILSGTIFEIPTPTELFYNSKRWWNITEITYNALRDEVRFRYTHLKSIEWRCAFEKDSDEYKQFVEIVSSLSVESAKEAARAFSGNKYHSILCNETDTSWHHCTLEKFQNACKGDDLNKSKYSN